MNGPNRRTLVLWLLATAACNSGATLQSPGDRAAGQSPIHTLVYDDNGEVRFLFNYPDCIPNCQYADKTTLANDLFTETTVRAAIATATSHVEFAMYSFSQYGPFKALYDAVGRGVVVRGVLDAKAAPTLAPLCPAGLCTFPPPFDTDAYRIGDLATRYRLLRSSSLYATTNYGERLMLLLYAHPAGSGVRIATVLDDIASMHHKLVMVDDRLAITSSGNWSAWGLTINLENYTFLRDPSDVGALACAFERLWAGDNSPSAFKVCQTARVFFSPTGPSDVQGTLVSLVDHSASSIDLTMTSLSDPTLLAHLQIALYRGVRLRVLLDDNWCMQQMPDDLKALFVLGANVRFLPTNCALMMQSHHKYAVLDGSVVVNGSGNWSKNGMDHNNEVFLVHDDPAAVDAFTQEFERAWAPSVPFESCVCDLANEECRVKYCGGDLEEER